MDHLFFEGWSTKKPLRDKAQFPWTTLYHLFSLKEYDIYIFLWGPLRRGGFRWSTKSISICHKGFSEIGVVHRGGGGPQMASLMVVSTTIGFFLYLQNKMCYSFSMKMSKSEAKVAYWMSKTPEERSEQGRLAALARHRNMSAEDKNTLIKTLQEARKKK